MISEKNYIVWKLQDCEWSNLCSAWKATNKLVKPWCDVFTKSFFIQKSLNHMGNWASRNGRTKRNAFFAQIKKPWGMWTTATFLWYLFCVWFLSTKKALWKKYQKKRTSVENLVCISPWPWENIFQSWKIDFFLYFHRNVLEYFLQYHCTKSGLFSQASSH